MRPIDVFEIRRAFFEVDDPAQGLDLFKEYGTFDDSFFNDDGLPAQLHFVDLIEWQAFLKLCQTSEVSQWADLVRRFRKLYGTEEILKAPEISISIESPITIRMYCDGVLGAIKAAIYLDKLANVKASLCNRPDCTRVFKHESRHERKFCSPECAHLEAVRKHRSEKRRT
jgi:hypothetical protein